jgi:putative flippase GtrA
MILLVEGFAVSPTPSSLVGFVVGAFINYVLNYRLTFQSTKGHQEAFVKFFLVAALGAILNTAIVYGAVNIAKFYYLLSQMIATATVVLGTFLGNRYWTFREVTDGKIP